jgi:hypothetical protein
MLYNEDRLHKTIGDYLKQDNNIQYNLERNESNN